MGETRTDLDIWVATSDSPDAPWDAPVNLGDPVNSTFDDFCPTPVRGQGLFFVSRRAVAGGCGGFDIYVATRASVDDPWSAPVNLGEVVNTANNETRGSLSRDAQTLYFGRAPGPEGSTDIYVTTRDKLTGGG